MPLPMTPDQRFAEGDDREWEMISHPDVDALDHQSDDQAGYVILGEDQVDDMYLLKDFSSKMHLFNLMNKLDFRILLLESVFLLLALFRNPKRERDL